MGDKSGIEWTDATWNPTIGCTRISAGCKNCYFFELHDRRHKAWLEGKWPAAPKQYHWSASELQMFAERLDQPLRWKRPRRIFVNSLSDLFHKDVPDEFVDRVFAVMAQCPRHTFQVLTKRPERMRAYLTATGRLEAIYAQWYGTSGTAPEAQGWPLPNVWVGASVEDQKAADSRIPELLETPAQVRFLSCEPLLGFVNIDIVSPAWRAQAIRWVIVGGESGTGARPMRPDWVVSLRDQCRAARVPFFFKQWGMFMPSAAQPIRGVNTGGGVYVLEDGRLGSQDDWWDGRAMRMNRVTKKSAAGRMLGLVEYSEFPGGVLQ